MDPELEPRQRGYRTQASWAILTTEQNALFCAFSSMLVCANVYVVGPTCMSSSSIASD